MSDLMATSSPPFSSTNKSNHQDAVGDGSETHACVMLLAALPHHPPEKSKRCANVEGSSSSMRDSVAASSACSSGFAGAGEHKVFDVKDTEFTQPRDELLELPELGQDCLATILQALPVRGRCMAAAVSRTWRKAALNSPTVWKRLDLVGMATTDEALDRLLERACGQVEELSLSRTKAEVSASALRRLAECSGLRSLAVHSSRISGSDLLALLPENKSSLKVLEIEGCTVSEGELEQLREIDVYLDIGQCPECDQICSLDDFCCACDLEYCSSCTTFFCEKCEDRWCIRCSESNDVYVFCCSQCQRFLCTECDDSGQFCDTCSKRVCYRCIETSFGVEACAHCDDVVCHDCSSTMRPCPLFPVCEGPDFCRADGDEKPKLCPACTNGRWKQTCPTKDLVERVLEGNGGERVSIGLVTAMLASMEPLLPPRSAES